MLNDVLCTLSTNCSGVDGSVTLWEDGYFQIL